MECGNWPWKWAVLSECVSPRCLSKCSALFFLSCLFGIPEVGSKLALQVVVLVLNYIFSKVFVFSEKEKAPVNPVKRNCYILGFAIPALTIALAFAVNQVFPFGDHGVLIIDSLHQYLPFFTEFHEKLEQGSSLRYSFGGGLGFNFWATYAYYLASPAEFPDCAFPEEKYDGCDGTSDRAQDRTLWSYLCMVFQYEEQRPDLHAACVLADVLSWQLYHRILFQPDVAGQHCHLCRL